MSTKTTFKRIALVAVAALGFGVLTSVAPASAAEAATAKVGTIALSTPGTGRVGTAVTSTIKITEGGTALANTDNITLRAMFVSVPAGSTAKVAFASTGAEAPFLNTLGVYTAAGAAGNELYPAKFYLTANGAAATAKIAGVVGFTPDVVGSYVVRVWHDQDLTGSVTTGETSATDLTFTVGSAPAAITVTKVNGTTAVSGTNGALVKIALTDAAVYTQVLDNEIDDVGILLSKAAGF